MFEALGQAFGSASRLRHAAGRHRSGDGQELGLDPRRDPAGTRSHEPLEPHDGGLEPWDRCRFGGREQALPPAAPRVQLDDRSHRAKRSPGL